MPKYSVSVYWEGEVEAEDEGDALIQASSDFDFIEEARAEEQSEYEDEEG